MVEQGGQSQNPDNLTPQPPLETPGDAFTPRKILHAPIEIKTPPTSKEIQSELKGFEAKFGLTTEQFLAGYRTGELPSQPGFVRWHFLCMCAELEQSPEGTTEGKTELPAESDPGKKKSEAVTEYRRIIQEGRALRAEALKKILEDDSDII